MVKRMTDRELSHLLITGKKLKRRKPFKISTKKMEWMSAGKRDPLKWRSNFVKTSYCRECGRKLIWGDRTYEFDHKDNNSSTNLQRNCYLVCRICHGKHTKLVKRKIRDKISGTPLGYKTIKKKVGYKKKRKTKKKTTKRRIRKFISPLDFKIPKFNI